MDTGRILRALLCPGLMLVAGCGHHHALDGGNDADINVYPSNYKAEILSAMHAYLNYPTAIRDAVIAEPALKTTGAATRYLVCLKFNAKKNASDYAGIREIAAVFVAGRFDQVLETPREQCADAVYTPFPELQKLPP